jgi:hypothetical protein
MTDTALRLETRISRVRHDRRDLRVIRLAEEPRVLLYRRPRALGLHADSTGLRQLGGAFSLAAYSPHSIVYLRLRGGTRRTPDCWLDLVLLHSALQLPVSQWKAVRSRLGRGDAHTAAPDRPKPLPAPHTDPDRWKWRQSRNGVLFDSAAETLFAVGTRDGFRATGLLVADLLDDPAAFVGDDAGHSCVILDGGRRWSRDGRRGMPGMLHAQYHPGSGRGAADLQR